MRFAYYIAIPLLTPTFFSLFGVRSKGTYGVFTPAAGNADFDDEMGDGAQLTAAPGGRELGKVLRDEPWFHGKVRMWWVLLLFLQCKCMRVS